jgi:Xaa-Pro aminopeptidase
MSVRKNIDGLLCEEEMDALLLYSESFNDQNMYYLTKFLAPDPFIFLKNLNNEPLIVVNTMEFSRAKKESSVKDVRSYSDYNYRKIANGTKDYRLVRVKLLATVVEKELGKGVSVSVPYNFPSMAADILREDGFIIKPMFSVIEKAREVKEPEEIMEIKRVQEIVEEVVSDVITLLTDCDVDDKDRLICKINGKKKILTVQYLKSFMGKVFLDKWCSIEEELIVACGPPSADPHYNGNLKDRIKANQPIILDIYPRSMKSRYCTDMTRTVVKGKASDKVKRMFDIVFEVKGRCIDAIHSGVMGNEIFNLCCDIIEKNGYRTIRGGKIIERGFTHNLGHGVGLDIHESPGMGEYFKFPLRENNVITVEPGLYDPKVGGVRLEDIILVKKDRSINMTKMPVHLEI